MHNFRKSLRENRKKTKWVLFTYLVIFTIIGILLDIVIFTSEEPSLIQAFKNVITFQQIPFATMALMLIAVISIFATLKFFPAILLNGSKNKLVTEKSKSKEERELYHLVIELSIKARIKKPPKIYMINEPYMNAFASGWTEENSMVAITRGLWDKLETRAQKQAVIAHEISHIMNEDIKLTLVVGVLSNIMLLIVNNIIYFGGFGRGKNDASSKARLILIVLQFILPLITIGLQMYLSRTREFMADSGATQLTGESIALAEALKIISGDYKKNSRYKEMDTNETRRAAYIFDPKEMFSTHPPIAKRIEALTGEKQIKQKTKRK